MSVPNRLINGKIIDNAMISNVTRTILSKNKDVSKLKKYSFKGRPNNGILQKMLNIFATSKDLLTHDKKPEAAKILLTKIINPEPIKQLFGRKVENANMGNVIDILNVWYGNHDRSEYSLYVNILINLVHSMHTDSKLPENLSLLPEIKPNDTIVRLFTKNDEKLTQYMFSDVALIAKNDTSPKFLFTG
jgi:hypothetical protein